MKVSIVAAVKDGRVVNVRSMANNPYNGWPLRAALKQAGIHLEAKILMVFVDCGYHGVEDAETQI